MDLIQFTTGMIILYFGVTKYLDIKFKNIENFLKEQKKELNNHTDERLNRLYELIKKL